MGWWDVRDMVTDGMLPINVVDAEGRVVRRRIQRFNTETGEVISFCCTTAGDFIEEPEGEMKMRSEFFPAPLTQVKITMRQVEVEKKLCWDLQGR